MNLSPSVVWRSSLDINNRKRDVRTPCYFSSFLQVAFLDLFVCFPRYIMLHLKYIDAISSWLQEYGDQVMKASGPQMLPGQCASRSAQEVTGSILPVALLKWLLVCTLISREVALNTLTPVGT